jgi:hypothetical protein
MILVAGLIGASASPVAAQAGGSIVATATVIDMSLANATHLAAKSLSKQVQLGATRFVHAAASCGTRVRQDVGPATIFASDASRKEDIDGSHTPLVTIAYW